jgi:tetratricopeptide (TPR) repeat protein
MIPLREHKPSGSGRSKKEDLQFEIAFFEGIAERDPRYIEALQILGDAYTKTGELVKGLRVDQRLAKLCPTNPLVFYNLACSYALLNKIDAAFGALKRAVELGYDDARWLNKDPDLENIRRDKRFQRLQTDIQKRTGRESKD